ncbi:hypothetical protein B0H34DRAFT_368412 [Crassisporium funariophilum]|nr:hypothetical protein B0H34DRAFT_368412 [Crassisporium funariophilum]
MLFGADPSARLQTDLSRAAGASFAVLIWEWLITFDDEVSLIWSKENSSWLKWTFLFSRYFILAVQLCSRCLEVLIMSEHTLNHTALRIWYVSQVMVAALAVSALETVLVARVYALYNQRRWIGRLLLSMLVLEIVLALIGMGLNIPKNDTFVPLLITTHLPASFAYFGITALVVQCIILAFTALKYRHSPLKTVPLVRLMMRDGTFAFLMLTSKPLHTLLEFSMPRIGANDKRSVFGLALVVHTLRGVAFAVTGYACVVMKPHLKPHINSYQVATVSRIHEQANTSTTIIFTSIFTDRIAFEDCSGDSIQTRNSSPSGILVMITVKPLITHTFLKPLYP